MSGEKTEQPTQKKIRDARKKGQVSRSKDVSSTANIIGCLLFLWVMSRFYLDRMKEFILVSATMSRNPFEDVLQMALTEATTLCGVLILPLLLWVIILGVAANFFQVGGLFAFELIKPDLKKLNPASALKKIFSKKNFIEFLKSILQTAFLLLLFYIVLKGAMPTLYDLPYGGMENVLPTLSTMVKKIVVYASMAFIAVAAVDYFFQKSQLMKELRMTKEEIKQEYKEMEGDPHIKSKRKQLHRELLTNNMLQNVRKSTVVITNPTRLAVALLYDKEETKLPVIVAKGENLLAKRIVEIAEEEGIPVMMNVPLAWDLYEKGQLDAYIPSELIEPVAEVLKWVYRVKQQEGR